VEKDENATDDIIDLIYNDDLQEKNVLRVLLEYGLLPWDEEKTMADYIFAELDFFHFDNPELEHTLEVYREQYQNGLQPTGKSLLYHEDPSIRQIVTNIDIQPYELSPNWDKVLEGLNITNRDVSRQDVVMSTNYFKLRKIKKMFEENQRDMERATQFDEQLSLIRIHQQLKEEEQKITGLLGTVILK
jgi:DNA primase